MRAGRVTLCPWQKRRIAWPRSTVLLQWRNGSNLSWMVSAARGCAEPVVLADKALAFAFPLHHPPRSASLETSRAA